MTSVMMNLCEARGVTRELKCFQISSSKSYCSTPPSTSVPLKPPMAKTLLPQVTAEHLVLASFMSGRGSHWFVPVTNLLEEGLLVSSISASHEQQNKKRIFRLQTWVIDLSRSQNVDAIKTSKSHQPLGWRDSLFG